MVGGGYGSLSSVGHSLSAFALCFVACGGASACARGLLLVLWFGRGFMPQGADF